MLNAHIVLVLRASPHAAANLARHQQCKRASCNSVREIEDKLLKDDRNRPTPASGRHSARGSRNSASQTELRAQFE